MKTERVCGSRNLVTWTGTVKHFEALNAGGSFKVAMPRAVTGEVRERVRRQISSALAEAGNKGKSKKVLTVGGRMLVFRR